MLHSSHIGIEGCVRRARDTLYWPRMAAELRQYISKCDICLAHRDRQAKEPLLQHEVVARPWAKVAADLCEVDNRTLLVISDYYSNFKEVACLKTVTSRSVIKEMKFRAVRHPGRPCQRQRPPVPFCHIFCFCENLDVSTYNIFPLSSTIEWKGRKRCEKQ